MAFNGDYVWPAEPLGERIVVAVADTADRWLDASLGEALGVYDRDILNATLSILP